MESMVDSLKSTAYTSSSLSQVDLFQCLPIITIVLFPSRHKYILFHIWLLPIVYCTPTKVPFLVVLEFAKFTDLIIILKSLESNW